MKLAIILIVWLAAAVAICGFIGPALISYPDGLAVIAGVLVLIVFGLASSRLFWFLFLQPPKGNS